MAKKKSDSKLKKEKKEKKDKSEENLIPEEERFQKRIPREKLNWLLYLESKVNSAKKDVQIANYEMSQYMMEHVRKKSILKQKQLDTKKLVEEAEAERMDFFIKIEKELDVELKYYAITEDGRLIKVKEPFEDEKDGGESKEDNTEDEPEEKPTDIENRYQKPKPDYKKEVEERKKGLSVVKDGKRTDENGSPY